MLFTDKVYNITLHCHQVVRKDKAKTPQIKLLILSKNLTFYLNIIHKLDQGFSTCFGYVTLWNRPAKLSSMKDCFSLI